MQLPSPSSCTMLGLATRRGSFFEEQWKRATSDKVSRYRMILMIDNYDQPSSSVPVRTTTSS